MNTVPASGLTSTGRPGTSGHHCQSPTNLDSRVLHVPVSTEVLGQAIDSHSLWAVEKTSQEAQLGVK